MNRPVAIGLWLGFATILGTTSVAAAGSLPDQYYAAHAKIMIARNAAQDCAAITLNEDGVTEVALEALNYARWRTGMGRSKVAEHLATTEANDIIDEQLDILLDKLALADADFCKAVQAEAGIDPQFNKMIGG